MLLYNNKNGSGGSGDTKGEHILFSACPVDDWEQEAGKNALYLSAGRGVLGIYVIVERLSSVIAYEDCCPLGFHN
jgi:hypothetical protein